MYRFEAKLTLGGILGATRQNGVDVPNGAELEPAPGMVAGDGLAPEGRGGMMDGSTYNCAQIRRSAAPSTTW
jgi:hypothetical protein